MGLILNSSKCELLTHPGVTVNDKRLQSFQRVLPSDATLLGAPLFHGPVPVSYTHLTLPTIYSV